MPRRRKPKGQGQRRPPSLGASVRRVETGADGYEYEVRAVSAARATKVYRCPGCDQEIKPHIAHVVVWRSGGGDGLDDRRHWHTPCWDRRATRGPTRRWS